MTTNHRRGAARLKEIDGEVGVALVENLNSIAPDFADDGVDFTFGEIYSRPGLNLKSREIAAAAALTALGTSAGAVSSPHQWRAQRGMHANRSH